MRDLTVGPNDSDQRLDRYLQKYFPRAPKSWLQKMIREKRIKVNKKRAEPSQLLQAGDELEIYIYEEVLRPYERKKPSPASRLPLKILYEDGQIAIIDKPAGVLVHPASPKDYGKTIVDAFTSYLIQKGDYQPRQEKTFTPALANRLDYNTGGLLIGLKTHQAAMAINQALRTGQVRRYYRAYCWGCLDQALSIDKPLEKVGQTMTLAAEDQGVEAITRVQPLRAEKDWSYLDIELLTGRYHQIRAHLSAIGHPLIGDPRYGDKGRFGDHPGQLLLAWRLRIPPLEALGLEAELDLQSPQERAFAQIQGELEEASRQGRL